MDQPLHLLAKNLFLASLRDADLHDHRQAIEDLWGKIQSEKILKDILSKPKNGKKKSQPLTPKLARASFGSLFKYP